MIKKLMLLILSVAFSLLLCDDFIISAYTQYNHQANLLDIDQETALHDISSLMKEANFTHLRDTDNPDIPASYGLEPIVITNFKNVSAYTDVTLEAEFFQEELPKVIIPSDWPNEMKWYQVSTYQFNEGYLTSDNAYRDTALNSYNYLRTIPSQSPGYIMDYITSPWKRYGNERRLKGQLHKQLINNEITFKVRYQGALNSSTIFRLGYKVLFKNNDGTEVHKPMELQPLSSDTNDYDTYDDSELCITGEMYANKQADQNGYKTFTFALKSFNSMEDTDRSDTIVLDHHDFYYVVSPTIWYSGSGTLFVDNVNIVNRNLKNFPSSANITYRNNVINAGYKWFAGIDEPRESSFKTHKRVLDFLTSYDNEAIYSQSIPKYEYYDACLSTNPARHLASRAFMYLGGIKESIVQSYPSSAIYSNNWTEAPESHMLNSDYILSHLRDVYETFQGKISIMLEDYREEKEEILKYRNHANISLRRNIMFNPAIQSYGALYRPLTGPYSHTYVWGALQPPPETQKMLAFLPLCYGADGITYYNFHTFLLPTDNSDIIPEYHESISPNNDRDVDPENFDYADSYQRSLVNRFSGDSEWQTTPQYYAVKEANREIQRIGSIIKELNWNSDKTTTLVSDVNKSFDLVTPGFNSITMKAKDPSELLVHNDYIEGYEGFVECSIYDDNTSDYLMLVNRRANFPKNSVLNDGEIDNACIDINNPEEAFVVAEPQQVEISFSNVPQGNYVFVDMYDGTIFSLTDNISIDAGDARLLKLTKLAPTSINSGSHIIEDTSINSSLYIENAFVTLKGNIFLKNNATLTIAENATLNLQSANIYCDSGSMINVHGDLESYESSLDANPYASANMWEGIKAYEGSIINFFYDSKHNFIKNANRGINIYGGEVNILGVTFEDCFIGINTYPITSFDLNIQNTTFKLNRHNSIGLKTKSTRHTEEYNVTINGFTNKSVRFVANKQSSSVGIRNIYSYYTNVDNFSCSNVVFENLKDGIEIISNYKSYDIIQNCDFNNNINGIYEFGTGKTDEVKSCTFNNNDVGVFQSNLSIPINNSIFNNNGIAIDMYNITNTSIYIPTNNSTFNNNGIAIDMYNTINTSTYTNQRAEQENPPVGNLLHHQNVKSCRFEGNNVCIRTFKSSPRIETSKFTDTNNIGIQLANGSMLSIWDNANNVFYNSHANFKFHGIEPEGIFTSKISMKNGHNDFYQSTSTLYDMMFSENYYGLNNDGSPYIINATGNYWSDNDINVLFESPNNRPIIEPGIMDETPNITQFFFEENNRFDFAFNQYKEGNHEVTISTLKAILLDKLQEEEKFWMASVERTFEISHNLNFDMLELASFYESIHKQVPDFMTEEEYMPFFKFLEGYIAKCYEVGKEFQKAVTIYESKIEKATSEEEIIYAQFSLETVNLLSEIEGNGRSSVVTSQQNLPMNAEQHVESFTSKWDRLNELWKRKQNTDNDFVPSLPTLSKNYPNPFNPSTTISFSIPEKSNVDVSIYNIKGQKVKTLKNGSLDKGNYEVVWNGDNNNNDSVSSGVYFYRLSVNGKQKDIKKCLLLK